MFFTRFLAIKSAKTVKFRILLVKYLLVKFVRYILVQSDSPQKKA